MLLYESSSSIFIGTRAGVFARKHDEASTLDSRGLDNGIPSIPPWAFLTSSPTTEAT